MSYSHLFFYRHLDGTEGFGYYSNFKEASERMEEFAEQCKHYGSKVEFGIAEIDNYASLGMEESA